MHKALKRFEYFVRKVSKNNTRTYWVLKCDIRKFFASIDQVILMDILRKHITDQNVLWLFERVIKSFNSTSLGKGLPLGNLTSQLLVNIYMRDFDQFVKHKLKQKYYIRYADDFVIISENRILLLDILKKIEDFLLQKLKLKLHPDKVFIQTINLGVDFLGWVYFSKHRVLRTVTKKRMFRNIENKAGKKETVTSYLGFLKHGNSYKLRLKVLNLKDSM